MIGRYTPILESSWDPFAEMNELRRAVNRLFGSSDGHSARRDVFPPLNIYANGDEVIIAAEVPGVDGEHLDVSVTGNTFTLEGKREPEEHSDDCRSLRQERFGGRFRRTVELPFAVDADKVQAKLKNGILQVRLPRAESDKPRKIEIGS